MCLVCWGLYSGWWKMMFNTSLHDTLPSGRPLDMFWSLGASQEKVLDATASHNLCLGSGGHEIVHWRMTWSLVLVNLIIFIKKIWCTVKTWWYQIIDCNIIWARKSAPPYIAKLVYSSNDCWVYGGYNFRTSEGRRDHLVDRCPAGRGPLKQLMAPSRLMRMCNLPQ